MSLHIGDIGKTIRIDAGADYSANENQEIDYIKPDGVTTGFWPTTRLNGNNFEFDTVAASLDQGGMWTFQAGIRQDDDSVDVVGDKVRIFVDSRANP